MRKPRYLSTVADEMIATGLLKELGDSELRMTVAGLPEAVQRISTDHSDQRQALNTTMNELAKRVEFRYQGSLDMQTARSPARIGSFEGGMTVSYDFESLVDDSYFINLMIETADTFGDLYSSQRTLCRSTEEVDALLRESITR